MLRARAAGFAEGGSVWYESADCTGTPRVGVNNTGPGVLLPRATIAGTFAFYAVGPAAEVSVQSEEAASDPVFGCEGTVTARGLCCVPPAEGPDVSAPADVVDLSGFVPPFQIAVP